ncbi:MAG: acyl-CoA thioesterase [Planctomycetes bacterium]|nr:acyl-CoA thioesterase [Planctomycetota bacterium]
MALPPHRMTLRVRYLEADRLGQVNSSCYPVYMEMGRTEMLRATGMTYRELESDDCCLVVAKLHLTFHKPARYDDELTLETTVARATSARIDHQYRFVRDDLLLAEGHTTLACVTRQGELRRMPEALLERLGIA